MGQSPQGIVQTIQLYHFVDLLELGTLDHPVRKDVGRRVNASALIRCRAQRIRLVEFLPLDAALDVICRAPRLFSSLRYTRGQLLVPKRLCGACLQRRHVTIVQRWKVHFSVRRFGGKRRMRVIVAPH